MLRCGVASTRHTIVVSRNGRVAGLKRRMYALTIGRGRGAPMRKSAEDTLTLGSHEQNQVVVAHPTVSRFHARVELDPNGFLLRDLDSTNGTFVNGLRVGEAYLPNKAKILLGDAEIGFELLRDETELHLADGDRFGAMVGQSPSMRRLFDELERVAKSDATVLLAGESGTGKDLVAQEIHRHSARRNGPFVVVDCGGIPDALIESELFGHERGAFTGADRTREGAFVEAHGGSLFLDEIAELPPSTQTKLLRALEAKSVKRVGGNQWQNVDVRVIAATHQDLAKRCNQRLFREDLYFRLAVLPLRIPPLRDRLEDLPLLVGAILEELGASTEFTLDESIWNVLRARRWSGNVRELKNLIQRALVLGPAAFDENNEGNPGVVGEPYKAAKARAIEHFEKAYLTDLLARHGGNVAKAARAGEVDPAWIFRLIKRYAIDVAALRNVKTR
jgi:transcriptional regulator with GAF, ATPase, and Fis domain